MSCKKIQNELLLFLDHELPDADRKKIQRHLADCPDCSMHLKKLASIWERSAVDVTIEPSPWLWNRIASQAAASKNRTELLSNFWESIAGYAVPVAATIIILIGVLAGAYLGTLPNASGSNGSPQAPLLAARAELVKTAHLDAFDDLPPASIGGAYLSVEANQ